VEQLLNSRPRTLSGRTYYLVRWQGHASADDSWEPVEHLAHCPERVAEYEATPPRRPKALRVRHRARGSSSAAAAGRPLGVWQPRRPPLHPPRPCLRRVGPWWSRRARRCRARCDPSVYCWPDEGWQVGRVCRHSRQAPRRGQPARLRSCGRFAPGRDLVMRSALFPCAVIS
jgi:hypothetical protein